MPDQTPSMPPLPDSRLLELAAMASGIELWTHEDGGLYIANPMRRWSPLTDDGDALRLAVQLDIQIWRNSGGTVSGVGPASSFWGRLSEPLKPDPYAATRRAIVKAAAEIGARLLPTLSLAGSKEAP